MNKRSVLLLNPSPGRLDLSSSPAEITCISVEECSTRTIYQSEKILIASQYGNGGHTIGIWHYSDSSTLRTIDNSETRGDVRHDCCRHVLRAHQQTRASDIRTILHLQQFVHL